MIDNITKPKDLKSLFKNKIFLLSAGLVLGLILKPLLLLVVWHIVGASINSKIRQSIVSSILYGLIIWSVIVTSMVTLLSPLGYSLGFSGLVILSFIIGVVFLKWYPITQKMHILDKTELLVLASSLTFMIFVSYPFVSSGGTSARIQILTTGEDNASHFAMTKYNFESGRPPYFDRTNSGLINSLNIYPQGMHITYSSIIKIVAPNSNDKLKINLYIFCTIGFFTIMFYLFGRVLNSYLDDKKYYSMHAQLLFQTTTLLLFISGPLFQLYVSGFQSQILSYIYMLMLIQLYIVSWNDKKFIDSLLLYVLLLCGIANNWYLLLPIAGAPLGYKIIRNFSKLKELSPITIISLLLLSISAGIPILVSQIYSDKINPLNEPGGVFKIPLTTIACLGLVGMLFIFYKKVPLRARQVLAISTSFAAIITTAIYAYQKLTIGRPEYYFFKTLFNLYIFGLIAALSLLFIFVINNYNKTFIYVLTVGMIFLFILAKPVQSRVHFFNWYNHATNVNDLEIVLNDIHQENTDTIFYGDCLPASDYLDNRWSGALELSSSGERSQLEIASLNGKSKLVGESLLNYVGLHQNTIVYFDNECGEPEIKDQLITKGIKVFDEK